MHSKYAGREYVCKYDFFHSLSFFPKIFNQSFLHHCFATFSLNLLNIGMDALLFCLSRFQPITTTFTSFTLSTANQNGLCIVIPDISYITHPNPTIIWIGRKSFNFYPDFKPIFTFMHPFKHVDTVIKMPCVHPLCLTDLNVVVNK